ncbi:hypothetical protein ASD83_05925 [Devosia sp. Root685]|uniref:hypothetical protein n=1 Tax=Devosia sp. Root685 TaxID=1736587 RepID=UPI0006F276A9|nr:hypothetical protein [Devosia sp. Root685]KRB01069.1 hypothetical protein ASD83_05925 [Devosia sp. Root685]
MSFKSPQLGLYIRIVALLSLLLGLSDAGRLLGVNLGAVSPVAVLGPAGFVLLGIFSLSRLFAGVGLWLKASWGAVLLVGSTTAELALYLAGSPDIRMSAFGFAVRIVLLAAISIIFALSFRFSRAQAAD